MESTSAGSYTYKTLQPGEIRLLRLLPSTTRWSKIRCTLEPAALRSNPDYKALSYTWGQEPPRHTILCEGRPFAVRENLYRALRRLRRATEPLVLWIDAICINQGDLDEKKSQIPMMSDIYYQAERVVIWLGESADGSDKAMALLNRLGHVSSLDGLQAHLEGGGPRWKDVGGSMRRLGFRAAEAVSASIMRRRLMGSAEDSDSSFDLSVSDSEPEAVGLDRWRSFESLSEVKLPRRGSKAWTSLRFLLDRPWFYRAWVIQEVGLAKTVVLTCGKRSIPWGKVGIVAMNMSSAGFPEEAGGKLWSNIVRMRMMRRGSWYMGGDSDDDGSYDAGDAASLLASLLITSRHADATDPRDKVYALYGFLETRLHDVPVEVDYRVSPQELYRRIAFWLIEEGSASVVFQMAGMRRSLDGLPSWVPDWSVPQRDAWWKVLQFFESTWSDTAPQVIKESQDPNVLVIGAKVVARITWAGVGISWETDEKRARTVLDAALRDWTRGIAQASTSGSCAFEPFWQAILGNWDSSVGELRQGVAAWFSRLQLDIDGIPQPPNSARSVEDDSIENLVAAAAISCIGHKLCLTSTGSLLLAPLGAVEGDDVVCFGGGGSLFVLRDERDGKVLVGSCSVSEDREWSDLLPKEESDLQIIGMH